MGITEKTKQMIFSEDKYVDGKLTYQEGKKYDIAIGSVDRWLKRGGVLVADIPVKQEEPVKTEPKAQPVVSPVKQPAPQPNQRARN